MDLVPDEETKGFSFIWTIQNFKYCLQKKGESLYSPRFKLDLSDNHEWCLRLYPRGYERDGCIGVFLHLYSSGPFPVKVKNHFLIRSTNGTFKRRKEIFSSNFESQSSLGCACFLNHSDLFKKGENTFLEKGTLTLRCRIRKEHSELPVSGNCNARTVIDVKRIAFDWSLENFKDLFHSGKKTMNFYAVSSENQSFTVDIFLSGEIYNKKKIQVEIKQNEPHQKSFMTCKLSLVCAGGKTVQSVHDDHWFGTSNETPKWHFTFVPVEKILEHEKLYLVNGALSLSCEFAVSSGVKYSEVENIDYGVNKEHDKAVNTGSPGSCKDNLQQVFKKGKFSDLTIRTTSSKEFPVHKAILCERSEVFNAMFEHDTKENRTGGVVEIGDLNDDAVSKMLLFIYTDVVEDLEWKSALDLYFAADKYGIMSLKRECSTFLKGNLNCSNFCEVLVLADMHQDEDMKSAVQDFVLYHATEIINSDYWKKFIQEQPSLAAEVMHLVCMRNLKI